MGQNFRRLSAGLQIIPRSDASSAPTVQGEFATSSVDGNIYYNNGTSTVILDDTSSANTLTNKTIAVSSNFITSTPNTAAQFNATTGNLESSVTTAVELAFVHGVTSSIQTQLNNTQPAGSYISSLTGDVTATGPGAAAATVVMVGGSSASNIHNAELLANAATSADTPNTIVLRDGSGNFIAGQISASSLIVSGSITANITGTASGNTTYTPNNHGLVLSSTTNAMNVLAPNASTAFPLISGGSSADPSWAALSVAGGGTGQTSALTQWGVVYAPTTTSMANTSAGSAGTVLTSNGTSAPTFQTSPGAITNNYFSGYMPTNTTWAVASPQPFIDPATTGSNTLTTLHANSLVVTAAATNVAGITFTPASTLSAYKISASFQSNTNSTGSPTRTMFQLTDGTNFFALNAQFSPGGTSAVAYPVNLEGIFVPGTTSPVTVKIQLGGNSNLGYAIGDFTGLLPSIVWTVVQIR